MGDVPVATNDNVASFVFHRFEHRVKRIKETVFHLLTFFRAASAGQIKRNDAQPAKIATHKPPFPVEFFNAHADLHIVGFAFAVHRHTAVTALLGAMPMAVHPVRIFHIGRQICFLRFEFLYADNVRARCGDVFVKSLFISGADAVDVGGNDFKHNKKCVLAIKNAV